MIHNDIKIKEFGVGTFKISDFKCKILKSEKQRLIINIMNTETIRWLRLPKPPEVIRCAFGTVVEAPETTNLMINSLIDVFENE